MATVCAQPLLCHASEVVTTARMQIDPANNQRRPAHLRLIARGVCGHGRARGLVAAVVAAAVVAVVHAHSCKVPWNALTVDA